MTRRPQGPLVALVGAGFAWLVAACPTPPPGTLQEARTVPAQGGDAAPAVPPFRLSEATGQEPAPPRPRVAEAKPLDAAQTELLLARLPALPAEEPQEEGPKLRPGSLPPPRTGKTVKGVFPPPEQRERPAGTQAKGPLTVERVSPEGEVALAPRLSITFSQPMIAVSSQDAAAAVVPVKLTPEPEGKWRWVGTRTLIFEPEPRFPMATEYVAEVPAGTKSASGAPLARATRWTFATPPPSVLQAVPRREPQPLSPVLALRFDQAVDPAAVLEVTKLQAAGRSWPLRLATKEEVAADPAARALLDGSEPGRLVALRPAERLAPGTDAVLVVGPGTPSAEGPRRSVAPFELRFSTFAPLAITEHLCGWGSECRPGMPLQVTFNNPLDEVAFDPMLVTVEPELPGLKVAVHYQGLAVTGETRGRTRYTMTIGAGLRDRFGQTLGKPANLTFEIGQAQPGLFAQGGPLVVLDPAGKGQWPVYSVNQPELKVRLYSVKPEDHAAWLQYQRGGPRRKGTPPGKLVKELTVRPEGGADQLVETGIDLGPALEDGLGQVIAVVSGTMPPDERRELPVVEAWLQSTRLGLDAFVDGTRLVAWATSLRTGKPVPGARLTLQPWGLTATAGDDGLARFDLPGKPAGSDKELGILVARNGRDVALLPEHPGWGGATSWRRNVPQEALLFYTFDDRGLYRPGETAHVKGWVRRRSAGTTGDLVPLAGAARSLDWTLRDSRGNEVRKGTAQLDSLGGFDLTLALPPELNLGAAMLALAAKGGSLAGQQHSVMLRIEEVRRPEFEVTASTAGPGPFFAGSSAEVLVKAAYYAGGGLPDAEVRWNVTSTPAFFTPPDRDDFSFGPFVPWWEQHGHGGGRSGAAFSESRTGRTDGSGTHHLRIDLAREGPRRATAVEAEATVIDVNRQAWSSRTQALVHPADVYVGLKSDRAFVQRGEPLLVDTLVVDLDGRAVAGRAVTVRTARLEWTQKQGKWAEEEVAPKECALTSAKEPVRCERATSEGGTYRVRATVTDAAGRRSESELNLWVAGGKLPPRREVEQEKVTLIPDRKEYQPGETAQLLVQAPFYPAEGLLTIRRNGLAHTERFSMQAATKTLAVSIDELSLPRLEVQVDLVGAALREGKDGAPDERLPRRPAFAAGQLGLPVPPRSRTLAVVVKPAQEKLAPGESTELTVEVKDAAGKPVSGADVAVVVVDEAILALTGYRIGDPVAAFHPPQPPGVRDHHLRAQLLLSGPPAGEELHAQRATLAGRRKVGIGAMPGATGMPPPEAMAAKGGEDDDAGPTPIRARALFDALALFAPKLPTDATGRTKVTVKLPDSLTRYRITAVAISGEKLAGFGEGSLTARLPLMARPSAPRFLNFGDRIELPVVVQNQTDVALTVDVAARGQNVTVEGTGLRVEVPANDRVEVRFPVATLRAGKARLQVAASAGKLADAATAELPVWTPATTEAFATYGELDSGVAVERLELPPDAEPAFGELEVTTSSTALQALTDAVLYLVAYPYECAEQLASRVLAVAALKDVLSAFDAEGLPPPAELQASVKRDLERLAELQAPDGGFGFWSGRDESWPWVSIHVAHALSRAEAKGFAVPGGMKQRALEYLRGIERQTGDGYGPAEKQVILAYAFFVRRRLGDPAPDRARQLVREAGAEQLPLEAAGFLLQALTGEQGAEAELTGLRRAIANRATEEAGTAHFVTSYGDRAHLLLHSDRRADGILLEALIADQPKSTLIPKLVRGLLGHRIRGRWANTQENAFVLLALDRYFAAFEQATPAFVSRVWLGNAYAGEHRFQGRTTERHEVQIPMAALARGGAAQELTVAKEGAGRLYYRLGLRYAPKSLALAPSEHGFTVERRYEAVDDPADVRREADGWHVKAGARVRVKLTMVAPGRRTHVALTDALPAGLEPVNPELATSGRAPREADAKRSWWGPWYQHQNLRDERAEAFTTLLREGVHTYSYVARATTPGRYVVPPPKAEEMYQPETFGRGGTDRVIVE